MKTTMNLTTDPWIPVISESGALRLLSLRDVFATAQEIRDLTAKPHEKIALLRLLICITQAALDGPEDEADWENCRDAIQPKTRAYLGQWEKAFELFGDGPRFLQVPGLKPGKEDGEGNPATKLDLTLASGNNASIFDNAAGNARPVNPARLALTLLTFQCFAPGGRIGVAKWNDADTTGKGSSNHAPCIPSGMLHTFLQGVSLLETLHLNLLNKQEVADQQMSGWGRPVWEMPITSATDKAAIGNATSTYLGRLVPLSRAVRLHPDGLEIVLANGLDYPLYPIFREPAATVVPRKEEPGILGVSLGRSIWRQLSAITVKRFSNKDPMSGPLALKNLAEGRGATLWIGALATDKAKIEDVVEAAYDVPAAMFRDAGRKLYEEGIALTESWQDALAKSIKAYAGTLKLEPPPYDRARQHFWTGIEQHVPELLKLAGAPDAAGDLKESEWGRGAKRAAHEAYEFACAHQSPRQIEAYAIGRQQLFLPKPKDASTAQTKSTRIKQRS
ncbi:MAG TPA: type I-E CRISPR-associated protein Cse1/CasA [Chthoniobacterales bacterium]|nr:type I-E CRISPR-associated protein Cse1/CasA [Chthoniobacterales bacterium]